MSTAAEIRAWARSVGMDVGARGRIAPAIRSAYERHVSTPAATNVRVIPATVTAPVDPPYQDAS